MMEADIFEAQALGVDAVAIGALTDAGRLDLDLMEQLSASAGGMQVVANFAVDEIQADAQTEAFTWLADHDFDKVMTTNAGALATSDLFYLEVSEQRLTEALSGKTAVITTKI
ncbi:copper homeostasis protein CutC [Ligilactobacillus equi]|nr:copper homeostasis protein CutC [Ligilactobacillus equi]